MQALNAIDAITPAFRRTHEVLFRPFRFGRSWKLCATSYLAFAGGVFIPFFLIFFLVPREQTGSFAPVRAALLLGGSVFTVVFVYVFYLCARMELVGFEMVLTRAQFIRPMWRRYSARVWPWLWLKIAVGTALSLASAPVFIRVVKGVVVSLPTANAAPPNDPTAFFAFFRSVLAIYAIVFALFFVLKLIATVLHDFVMPFYLLEDITLPEAIRRGFGVIAADPVAVIGYLALKPVLALIGFILQYAATMVCFIPLYLVIIFGFVAGGALNRNGNPVVTVLLVCLGVVVYFAFIVVSTYTSIGTFGYLMTLLTAYGIYFLGGRYPLLGNMIDPGIGTPFTPPPVFPSEEERKDDDGGPPMPMNPAVA